MVEGVRVALADYGDLNGLQSSHSLRRYLGPLVHQDVDLAPTPVAKNLNHENCADQPETCHAKDE